MNMIKTVGLYNVHSFSTGGAVPNVTVVDDVTDIMSPIYSCLTPGLVKYVKIML